MYLLYYITDLFIWLEQIASTYVVFLKVSLYIYNLSSSTDQVIYSIRISSQLPSFYSQHRTVASHDEVMQFVDRSFWTYSGGAT